MKISDEKIVEMNPEDYFCKEGVFAYQRRFDGKDVWWIKIFYGENFFIPLSNQEGERLEEIYQRLIEEVQ